VCVCVKEIHNAEVSLSAFTYLY